MKNNLVKIKVLVILIFSLGFTACEKEDDFWANLKQQEIDDREAYIEAEGISDTLKTASGLYYIETLEGFGVQPTVGDKVNVHYTGMFLDGTIFDSSWQRSEPIEFTLGVGEVIPGWDEAIALMKEGGTARLVITSYLAYGATQTGSIPPYTTLVFDVELIEIINK